MFIGRGILPHSADMDSSLVSEGALSDEWEILAMVHVGNLADVMGGLRQIAQLFFSNRVQLQLQLDVSNDRAEIGIATAFAVAIDCALHMNGSVANGDDGVGHCHIAIVMSMDA